MGQGSLAHHTSIALGRFIPKSALSVGLPSVRPLPRCVQSLLVTLDHQQVTRLNEVPRGGLWTHRHSLRPSLRGMAGGGAVSRPD